MYHGGKAGFSTCMGKSISHAPLLHIPDKGKGRNKKKKARATQQMLPFNACYYQQSNENNFSDTRVKSPPLLVFCVIVHKPGGK